MATMSVQRFDEPLSVGVKHRLWFTHDAFDPANIAVREAFATGGEPLPRRALVLLDSGVSEATPTLNQRIEKYFQSHKDAMQLVAAPVIVPGGEQAKNSLDVFHRTVALVHEFGLCRRSIVLAIGGGAMLDAVGFGAATAHRGVRLVRMPTTTLGQDDAGIGVKNGVNLFGKKNFLGSFAVPWAVINDDLFLATLSDRDFRAGFSECVKVALVKDSEFFASLEADAARIARRERRPAADAIRRSAILHLHHITRGGDPYELTEARPLDFGHWAAHRLESISRFELRHGEAVAIGVMLDSMYSHLVGWLDRSSLDRIANCLAAIGFSLSHPLLAQSDLLLSGLEEFREHLGGRLTISLLRGIGRAEDVHAIQDDVMREAITRTRQLGD